MNTAKKGAYYENRSIEIYEAKGFTCIRAAGSKGAWDFWAVRKNELHFVQVRFGRFPGPAARRMLAKTPPSAIATRVLHRWMPRAQAPDVRYV